MLGYFPLAIDQAGGYIRATGTAVTEFIAIIAQNPLKALEIKSPYQIQVRHYTNTVSSTWSIAIRELEKRNKLAVDILSFISFLDPYYVHEQIPTALCGDEVPLEDIQRAVVVLQQFSLVRQLENGIWVHQLLQKVVQKTFLRGYLVFSCYSQH